MEHTYCKFINKILQDPYSRFISDCSDKELLEGMLNDPRIDMSIENNRAIRQASRLGHTEIVKMLLTDSRVDPSVNRNEAICEAVRWGHLEIVKMLLHDNRVSACDMDDYALRWAVAHNYIGITRLLLDHGAHVAANRCESLTVAVQRNHHEILDMLVKNPDVVPTNNLLSIACELGFYDCVCILLKDPNIDPTPQYNDHGFCIYDPLMSATLGNHLSIVERLLEDPRTRILNSTINVAIERNYNEIVKILIKNQ